MGARKLLLLEANGGNSDLARDLQSRGWEVRVVSNLADAAITAARQRCLVGVVRIGDEGLSLQEAERLPGLCPIEWIAILRPEVLADTQWANTVVGSFYDYHTLPLDMERLSFTLGHAYGRSQLKYSLNSNHEWAGRYQMIGRSAPMHELYGRLDRVVKVDAPVLISGESGTGKELVARAIHQHSERAAGPFVPVNCGGLAEHLIQSELFGHERGAFTGAHQRKIGSLETGSGGVVFLDEIGDLPLGLQANLLRFLQEKTIVRLGATQHIPIDVRVIAATHVDLERAMSQSRFREDLFYRLNVLHLKVPPLRSRAEDIELFAQALFKQFQRQKNPKVQGFSRDALRAMQQYSWPGNVRELFNRVQQAMIMSDNRLITTQDLGIPDQEYVPNGSSLSSVRATLERDFIRSALKSNAHNVTKTARDLGVSRVTLYRLFQKFEIERP
ncbi:MAG: sigma 54-interacting transcriptional regulator [Burkholderiales bacterium]